MRILLVTRGFGKKGGLSRTSLEAALQLAEKGHRITVVTNEVGSDHFSPNITIKKIHLLKLPLVSNRKLKNLVEVPQFVFFSTLYVLFNRRKHDIVWNKGNAQCLVQDVVTAESCHRAWIEQKRSQGERRFIWYPLHRFILWVEKRNYRAGRFKAITCISKTVRNDILQSYPFLTPGDIEVVYNGVNSRDFSMDEKARARIRRKHSIPRDNFVLLFVGWEFDRKGLEYVTKALPLIRGEIKLLVVGDSPKHRYERLAEKNGVTDLIEFCGATDEPHYYYSAADFFVFPTKMDAFGLVVLEAMCAGNIVITSKMAGASELIEEGRNGFILRDYTSAEEIASVINLLIDDRGLRSSVREKAIETAKENDWSRVGDAYERLFERIVANGARRGDGIKV